MILNLLFFRSLAKRLSFLGNLKKNISTRTFRQFFVLFFFTNTRPIKESQARLTNYGDVLSKLLIAMLHKGFQKCCLFNTIHSCLPLLNIPSAQQIYFVVYLICLLTGLWVNVLETQLCRPVVKTTRFNLVVNLVELFPCQ